MKVKNKKLRWDVLNWDFNSNKLINFNIFYQDFIDELYKRYKNKKINTKEDLKNYILLYCRKYWCRREYEILVGDLSSSRDEFIKIDVFSQVEMNIDRITEYVNRELEINL